MARGGGGGTSSNGGGPYDGMRIRWMGRSIPFSLLLRAVVGREGGARLLPWSLLSLPEGFSDWFGEVGGASGQPHSYSLV